MASVDLLRCPSGELHAWVYGGKANQRYRCTRCPTDCVKGQLKAETDA